MQPITSASAAFANLRGREAANPRDFVRFFDDFITIPVDNTTGIATGFVSVAEGADATAKTGPSDGLGGWLQVTCDGDDNDENYLSSGCEAFIFDTTREAMFEARVQLTAGSDDGKVSFVLGLSDTVAANSIVDAGTLMTSFDGALFCLEEGASGVDFVTSNAGTPVTTDDAYSWADAATVKLGFYYYPNDGVTAKVIPMINGLAYTAHDLTIAGLEAMHILLGIKTRAAAENALIVDKVEVIQER